MLLSTALKRPRYWEGGPEKEGRWYCERLSFRQGCQKNSLRGRHLCEVLQEMRLSCGAFIWRNSILDSENGKCKSQEAGISLES